MGRAPCCDKAHVKKGPWSPEEDAKLKEYIEKNGTGGNWIALPQKIGMKRCGKSCRLRWLNYLRPNIKHGGFTEEEDNIICSLYISIGSRWSIIAAQLPGRTDNDIKNYWNTRLKKKLLGRRKQSNTSRLSGATSQDQKDSNVVDQENSPLQNLSNSALERLQLHMQLQNLQSPFSFYNNPSLWPKLNPLQEKMLQILQHSNESQIQQIPPPITNTHPGLCQNSLGLLDQCGNCTNGISSTLEISKSNVGELQESGINHDQAITTFTQAEIDNFLMNSKSPVVDFDCLKEINDVTRENNLMWWSNDTNSVSSNSWDSNSLPHQSDNQGLYDQDYALGYSM